MATPDPQLFFRSRSSNYLDRLSYAPDRVDVLDIAHFDVSGLAMISAARTDSTYLIECASCDQIQDDR